VGPVAATLGTALTREQVRLLKSLVSQVVLVFDGDQAGARAMCRAFPLFIEEGLPVRVIALPAGQDPDTYVQAQGPELFASPWDAAQPWLAFLLDMPGGGPRRLHRRTGEGHRGAPALFPGRAGPGGTGFVAEIRGRTPEAWRKRTCV
jgi:DNA primase